VIFRTDLVAMERLKNVRLGVGVGEETHREVRHSNSRRVALCGAEDPFVRATEVAAEK
jgi:hypothetical protein